MCKKRRIFAIENGVWPLLNLYRNVLKTIICMSKILYKYLDLEGAKGMIRNRNLQFTHASQLNDPFDCHPKLLDYSNVPESKLQGWIPKKWWIDKEESDARNFRNETWLCSLSKINDSLLMWSHYCNNHGGVCIGLDMDEVMKSVPPMFGEFYISPLVLEVQYCDIIERPNAYDNFANVFGYQWKTKAQEWKYEQEVRLVISRPNVMYAALTPAQEKQNRGTWDIREIHHYMPLSPQCFNSIYFGINIERTEKDKLIQYVRSKLNPQIEIFQMTVDDSAFKLRPVIV